MITCKNSILEELAKGIVNINYNDNTSIPYTTLSKYNVTQTGDHGKINVYNLITDEIVCLYLKNIIAYITNSDKCTESYITQCKKDLESVDEDNKDISYKYYFDNLTQKYNLFSSLKLFNFCISPNEYISNILNDQQLEIIKTQFINLVKEVIDENVAELDEISKHSEDNDLEDINSIKEMFTDCIDEIDFSNVKNISDLIDCWPPLLLPLPEVLEDVKKCLKSSANYTDPVIDLKSDLEYVVENITDENILKDFILILNENKDNIGDDNYNKYLDIINNSLQTFK